MRKSGREQFQKFEKIIDLIVLMFSVFGKSGNFLLLRFFRNTNGKIGLLLRYIFLKNCAKSVGHNVSIQPGVFLFNLNNIEIGSNVSIHPMCYIEGAGGIAIGSNVSIAHSSTLISTNHTWDDYNTPIKYNKETYGKIVIEDDVWIGCGVRVLSGVKINSRVVIAAGSIVNREAESKGIYGGVPAKRIKEI